MEIVNTAIPALVSALDLILQPAVFLHLLLGVVLGLAVGVFPGLGGIAGLSLLLPFMFGMDPVGGLALMIGLVAVVPTSDTFASVLMGIPGSSASQATVLDGFPLARQGEGARALSAAFASSLFGGLIGAVFLTLFLLVARPLVLAFGLPEMLMVILLGLSMVSVLAGREPLKGLVSAGLGLMVGTIGEADAGGSLRMASYELPYLIDGFRLVVVALGIFAVPEIVALLRQDRAIAKNARLGSGWADGLRDWIANRWLSFRCAIIGVVVGVIPGLGGSVVDWIAYAHATQTTPDRSRFGKGEIRGVIAPESSNNAKEGGGLVPTLLFGIPGSGSMAVFVGAVALLGSGDIEVGPGMLRENLDITYAIVWLLAVANVFGTVLCIAGSGTIARLTTIRFAYLAPFLIMLISFAAFQSGQTIEDLLALSAFGLLGVFLRRFDWSRPAFLIGFVLSNPLEQFTNQAFQIAGFRFRTSVEAGLSYIFSPIVIVLLVLTVISVTISVRKRYAIKTEGESGGRGKRSSIVFLMSILAYLGWAVLDANHIADMNITDKIIPLVIGSVSLSLGGLLLIKMFLAASAHPVLADTEGSTSPGSLEPEHSGSFAGALAWPGMLIVLTFLFGFILALLIFLALFFRFRASAGWFRTAVLTGTGIALMCTMAGLLNRDFPPGLLQAYFTLPWPLT